MPPDTLPYQPENARAAPVEAAAEKPITTEAEAEKEDAAKERAKNTEDLSRDVDSNIADQRLEEGLAEDEPKSAQEGSPKKPEKVSRIDMAIGGIMGGIDKAGKMLAPFIKRITTLMQSFKESMRSSFGQMAGLLKKAGVNVPEWLIATVPGMAEMTNVLAKGSRILTPHPKDTETMRELMALHQRASTAAGTTYTIEQFFNDAVVGLPASMNNVSMTDIRDRAEEVAKQKEKEAEERRRTGAPAPVAAAPATPAPAAIPPVVS